MPNNTNGYSPRDGWNEWGKYVLKELERLNALIEKSYDEDVEVHKEINDKLNIKFEELNAKLAERFEHIAIEQAEQKIKSDRSSKLFSSIASGITLLIAIAITLL